jgi:exodeoxyribonuclease VII large subunit
MRLPDELLLATMASGMQQPLLDFGPLRKVYSVSELNGRIRAILDGEFADLWVAGEISGVRLASSGHYYFTLKDEESQLKCACFRMSARYLKFKPQDGVAVIARGRLDVYDARGEYQMLIDHLEPQGHGALQFAFEQLKKKLAAEGLFDPARRRPLPKSPVRIGIVTSPRRGRHSRSSQYSLPPVSRPAYPPVPRDGARGRLG